MAPQQLAVISRASGGNAGASWLDTKHGDATVRVPYTKWDLDRLALSEGSGMPPQFGIFLPNIDRFDTEAFGVLPSEAATMDPQQRLLLQAVMEVLPHGASRLVGSNTATFVGIGSNDYEVYGHHNGVPVGPFSFTAAAPSVASGR